MFIVVVVVVVFSIRPTAITNNLRQCRQLLWGEKLNNSMYLVDFNVI